MTALIALLLGIIQGLTEFIPISSTAHLTIAASVFGVIDPEHPEQWTAFMATIQLGTLAAVFAFFAKDIATIVTQFFSQNVVRHLPFKEQTVDARMGWFVILGSIPIVVVGLALKSVIEGSLTKNMYLIGCSLIGVAILLWLAERSYKGSKGAEQTSMKDAILVGLSQVLALFPGASRSGSTIMAGLFLGFNREHAARFSFLLSIPAIFGAGVLQFLDEVGNISWEHGGAQLLIATTASFVSGYWSIGFLLKYLRTRSLNLFIVYRLVLGGILLITGCSPSSDKSSMGSVVEQIQAPQPKEMKGDAIPLETDSAVITHKATINTTMGIIVLGLYGEDAPETVKNFELLAKRRYYDGALFHRAAKDFIIQTGDPKTKDPSLRSEWGTGGETASGKPLSEELNSESPSGLIGYQPGVLAMARKGDPNTGTSQFFICLEKASAMPYQYTIFGRVLSGIEVVREIGDLEVEAGPFGASDGVPKKQVKIKSIRIK